MAVTRRAAFVDKDGTLVRNVPYNVDPAFVVLHDGVPEGLRMLQRQGFAPIVISNQPGIARGHFTEQDLEVLERHLVRLLRGHGVVLHGFYWCPHDPAGNVPRYTTRCACRKPMPGLLLQAAREHGIDCGRSWMIGDILNDVEAGRRAGCRTALVDNGNETEWQWSALRSPDVMAGGFLAAARAIVESDLSGEAMPQ
jgi:D,D-heptose 1,7-bisphosphate phosphatase